jgi:ABC-type branched-subunit amino acid transport system substrate-binding protein
MSTRSRRVRTIVGGGIVAALATVGLATASGAAVPRQEEGVTAKAVKLGFIYPATGLAAPISGTGLKGFQARIDEQNAAGGVNGRKIQVLDRDDASSGQNLTAAKDLVENEHVFAVVNESPFAFLTYRYLLDAKVPMIGNGVDGTYYQDKGNEAILSSSGNSNPFGDLTYDGPARVMKMLGGKKVGALAYGAASSSVSSAKAFMNYAVPEVGLDPVYTNTSVDFGTSDVGPLVLGIKNAGAESVYLPMAASTDVAIAQGLVQSGVDMKATLMAQGYGQDFLDSPVAKQLPASTIFTLGNKPVELASDPAVKTFRSDLKKYEQFTGVPDFGMYTGYILADYAIKSLEGAGKSPTREGLVAAGHGMGTYDQAGLACQPVDVSLGGRGKIPSTNCGYYLQLKNGKFVLYPKDGKPVKGKLVGTPEALAAAKSGETATTTTAAPAS